MRSPKKSEKHLASLLSLASREKGESHDRNQKEAVQAGVARYLKQSSDWFKRTPSRFKMRVYGDFSCESRYESSDGSSDSSAEVFVDDLPSNAEKKIGVGSGVPRGCCSFCEW